MQQPWYKQFWPWFLITLPMTAVIGSIITIMVFSQSPVEMVVDDYYKKGKAINLELGKEQRAAELELLFSLEFIEEEVRLSLISGKLANNSPLVLRFVHPTQGQKDFSLNLIADAQQRFSAPLPQQLHGKWHVILSDFNQSWRLKHSFVLPLNRPLQLKPRHSNV